MSKIETGGPAFPTLDYIRPDKIATNQGGMTLRDYFAAKAMQAYLSGPDRDDFSICSWAKVSYNIADAMLEARNQP